MSEAAVLEKEPQSVTTADQVNVLAQHPQGSAFNDSQVYPDACDSTHPFHFDLFVPSNVLRLNYAKLSFFLRAFRAYVSATNNAAVTSGPSSASSSGNSTDHDHTVPIAGSGAPNGAAVFDGGVSGLGLNSTAGPWANSFTSFEHALHTHPIPHTHQVTTNVTLTYGIFESSVATGVTVKINGVDRTGALGGGSGFTSNQTELEVSQWLNIGQWNTIDLTPTGLGRIVGHLRVTGYIQAT